MALHVCIDSLLFVIHVKYEPFFSISTTKEFIFYFHFVDKSTEIIIFCLKNIDSSQSELIVKSQ